MAMTSGELAAVDLGSNSFHLVVARLDHGQLRIVDRLRAPVRIADGLDDGLRLTREARERALACLALFGQRIGELPTTSVRAVGTNTLRRARDNRDFLAACRQALGHEVEIISGYEEARLIYLGVAQSLAPGDGSRLVIDIGGGSTELIIGTRLDPRLMESLHMGCVGMTRTHFPAGEITHGRLQRAVLAARLELEPVAAGLRRLGWTQAVGSSGTIRTIQRACGADSHAAIGVGPLRRLGAALVSAGHVERIQIDGVSHDRAQVLPGGLAVLIAAFEALGIERMEAADGALREGLLHDLRGRFQHEDIREASVRALALRCHVDTAQAQRVGATASALLGDLATDWGLGEPDARLLGWAARLHEVGLDISHSQYHKHGEYLVTHSDLAGFSREEQRVLALLVRAHRRRFPQALIDALPATHSARLRRLAVLLRLAVVLHRGRGPEPAPKVKLTVANGRLRCKFPPGWLAGHCLVAADLAQEVERLQAAGIALEETG